MILSADDTQLWCRSAAELAHGIATGLFSAREVVRSCLERIDAVDPQLNALVEVRAQESLDSAAEADRLRVAGAQLGPLHGVPVSVKCNSAQAGYPVTHGL